MIAEPPEPFFWKRKLAAFLHDPPSHCVNLFEHVDWSAQAMSAAELDSTKYPRCPEWEACAADRVPFPAFRAASISCAFDGYRSGFHHPLGGKSGEPCLLKFEKELSGLDQLEGRDSHVQPVLNTSTMTKWGTEDIDRARFFVHWRFWRKSASEKDWRFNFLPADTRLPDHTIWHHMQVTSALAGCAGSDDAAEPLHLSFLKMQIGPVQDFIVAARSIRDLWSGSYLLSWLMAAGLKRLSELAGPDSVVFPSLWNQPLFDLHWRESLWSQVSLHPNGRKCWDGIKPTDAALLTPNLPNVFLALLPAARAAEFARVTEEAIRGEFQKIADSVWEECKGQGLTADESMITEEARETRFKDQIAHFVSISWSVTEWPEDLDASLGSAPSESSGMPAAKAHQRIKVIRAMAEKLLPPDHREGRHYHTSGKPDYRIIEPARLKSRGLAWSVILAHNAWELDGVRQLRAFGGRSGAWIPATANNKDSLTGKDEAVAGGAKWVERVKLVPQWKHLFKHEGDWLGAVTLVKRLWHLTYLKEGPWLLPTSSNEFSMPNLHSLAAGDPFGNDEKAEPEAGEKYFAVLAFDGDEIGKWISGEKTPPFKTQLADYAYGGKVQNPGMLNYFQRDAKFADFLETNRPVSPSYHLQFSEALGNFAIHCAASIVEGHKGRLIYCGGDDVLAVLPANHALECARDLNRAFTGGAPRRSAIPRINRGQEVHSDVLTEKSSGFLQSSLCPDEEGRPIPFVVPGPAASASVGIAIAHFKSPLQDVARAAQLAEKRAKNQLGRAAVAVSLFRRSGEISEWGSKWESGGLALYEAIAQAIESGALSSKFPHRVCQLLEPYLVSSTPLMKEAKTLSDAAEFDVSAVIKKEFSFAVSRQTTPGRAQETASLPGALSAYLAGLIRAALERAAKTDKPSPISETQELLTAVIGLCTTVAFAHRIRTET